jgi:two-component system sensor histidine kinase GlrK
MTLAPLRRFLLGTRFPLSFRQLLLIAFLGIILLLGGALVRTLMVVETLTEESRDYPAQALQTVEAVRELQDLTVTLERISRQYLVLNDPSLRRELQVDWDHARVVASTLGPLFPEPLLPLTESWKAQAGHALAPLLAGADPRDIEQPALFDAFRQLGELNQQIERESRVTLNQRNHDLIRKYEQQRSDLIVLGITAATVAAGLALGLGMWLAWSLKRLDRAIGTLGTPGQDRPIAIGGPKDIRRLGQRLEWLRQRLAALEADKQLFLRHISHELKTPLANLREGVALLEEEVPGALNDPQKEILAILRDNAVSLQHQIESLLQYNAVAFEARRLQSRPCDLRALLENLVERQRLQLQTRHIEATVEGPKLTARVDPEKIEIAVSNLLSNAIRFSPEGGKIRLVLGEIKWSDHFLPEKGSDHLRKMGSDHFASAGFFIDCIDEGPGIDPADQDRIFSPFYQGIRQPQGMRKGSGIGLSIVKELVEAHGGHVALLPSQGGAHFHIEIPYEMQ